MCIKVVVNPGLVATNVERVSGEVKGELGAEWLDLHEKRKREKRVGERGGRESRAQSDSIYDKVKREGRG